MSHRSPLLAGLLLLPLAAMAIAWAPPATEPRNKKPAAEESTAQPKAPGGERRLDIELRTFMRRKLDASALILEGLAIEDMALIRQGAHTLGEISTAEKWRVSTDPLYRQHSSDFREIVQELEKAANERNLDRAALKWMDATMSCLECHRFVRGMHIVDTVR